MKYRVVLIHNDEGFAVGCPAFPGCWSQGNTTEEALSNLQDAIQNVLEVQADLKAEAEAMPLDASADGFAAH